MLRMKVNDLNVRGVARARWAVGACSIVLAMLSSACETHPQPVTAWTECLPSDGQMLSLRLGEPHSRRQLVVRLWGDALRAPRLPHEINLLAVTQGSMPGASGLGDAQLCPLAKINSECASIAARLTMTSMSIAQGGHVQGRAISVGDTPGTRFGPVTFSGTVENLSRCG